MKTISILCAVCSVFINSLRLDAQIPNNPNRSDNNVSIFDNPVDFTGWKGKALEPQQLDVIRIGFFIPDDQDNVLTGPMQKSAHMAINEVNSAGGFHGIPFKLIIRWAHDPWGAGSKEMIKLVYHDSVWAVIGALDGTTTHIAEQIATKAWIPLLSPISADPTLTYIRIPWMFRLPPDYQEQARVIVKQGIQAMSITKVGLLTSIDHDGRIFAEEMLNQLRLAGVNPMYHFQIPSINFDPKRIAQRISIFKSEAIILQMQQNDVVKLLFHLQKGTSPVRVFLPWISGLRDRLLRRQFDCDIYHVQPFACGDAPAQVAFIRKYRHIYGTDPSPVAAYTYDAFFLLFHALQTSGLNRAGLRDAIAGIKDFQGASGKICWDNVGGNQAVPVLRNLVFDSEN